MPLKKSSYKNVVKPLEIPVGTDKLTIRYRPNLLTPAYQTKAGLERGEHAQNRYRELLASGWENDPTGALAQAQTEAGNYAGAKQLFEILAAWDYEGDDGQPVPLTLDELLDTSSELLGLINAAIGEDIASGEGLAPNLVAA